MPNGEVTMSFIQLLISFLAILLAIIGSYAKSKSDMAKVESEVKHQEGKIAAINKKMDEMKDENHDGQKDLWRKLDELASTMHRIELALKDKADRK